MNLQPKRPPGRVDRKAATYATEIRRLRHEGYTYEAIREALVEVGIKVSESALRREMRRTAARLGASPSSQSAANVPPLPVAPPTVPTTPSVSGTPDGTTSRDLAEAYFTAHPSNPLFRSKERP